MRPPTMPGRPDGHTEDMHCCSLRGRSGCTMARHRMVAAFGGFEQRAPPGLPATCLIIVRGGQLRPPLDRRGKLLIAAEAAFRPEVPSFSGLGKGPPSRYHGSQRGLLADVACGLSGTQYLRREDRSASRNDREERDPRARNIDKVLTRWEGQRSCDGASGSTSR